MSTIETSLPLCHYLTRFLRLGTPLKDSYLLSCLCISVQGCHPNTIRKQKIESTPPAMTILVCSVN